MSVHISDAAIVRLEGGRFRVPVYLLFADRQGRVTESRDEVLTFTGGGGGTICASLKTASVMRWDSGEVVKSAAASSEIGAKILDVHEYELALAHLHVPEMA